MTTWDEDPLEEETITCEQGIREKHIPLDVDLWNCSLPHVQTIQNRHGGSQTDVAKLNSIN